MRDVSRELGDDARLAVYGSLAPGEENERELADLEGTWRHGVARGRLLDRGWGARIGFPAFVPDPAGEEVGVQVFESGDLPLHWARLDAFEGPGYTRIRVPVRCGDEVVVAWIYALAEESQPR
ncbi:MAG: gamma-glutamylcyclotransferase family protein [Thermoanaerobaculia bacterium]